MKRKFIILLIIMISTSLVACSEPEEIDTSTNIETNIEEELNQWDTLEDYEIINVEDLVEIPQTEEIEENPETEEIFDTEETPETEEIEIAQIPETPPPTSTVTPTPTIIPTTESKPDITENNTIPEPVGAWHNYKKRNVLELYAVNFEEFTMQQYNVSIIGNENSSSVNEIINTLTDYTSQSTGTAGYFIKTKNTDDNGYEKEYVLLDDSNSMDSNTINSNTILTNGLKEVENSPKYASWLVHMSSENIESIDVMGLTGVNEEDYIQQEGITDSTKIQKISDYLKKSLTIDKYENAYHGRKQTIPSGYQDYFNIYLKFNNGVEYKIALLGSMTLEIYTTDLDKTVCYSVDQEVGEKLVDYISSIV